MLPSIFASAQTKRLSAPATANAQTQERNPDHKRRRRGGHGKSGSRPPQAGETAGAKWACNCMISSFRAVGDATIDSQLTFAATLKISGKPTFTDAVGA